MFAMHVLKCWPEPFRAVQVGEKTAELRLNDRDYRAGQLLALRHYDNEAGEYSGHVNPEVRMITHVQEGFGLKDGHVMLSFRRLQKHEWPWAARLLIDALTQPHPSN